MESWRRLRYPWAQSSPKIGEETTGLEYRTQAPSKKDPMHNCRQQSQVARLRQRLVATEAGPIAGIS